MAMMLSPALATAGGSCTVAAGGMAFGIYDIFSPVPTDAMGTVLVSCDDDGVPGPLNITIAIALSPSAVSGTSANRQMQRIGGSELLNYNLYQDAACSRLWGDIPGVDDYVIPKLKVPNNGSISLTPPVTIYGRIPAGQDVPPGDYADSVVLTITP